MAIALDATVGGESANAYIDEVRADELLEQRGGDIWAGWSALTSEQKKAALISATNVLEDMEWAGVPATDTQALRWPRDVMYDLDGYAIDETTIPAIIERQTATIAYNASQADLFSDSGTEGFSEIAVGPIKLKVDKQDRTGALPDKVMRAIRHLLRTKAFNSELLRS